MVEFCQAVARGEAVNWEITSQYNPPHNAKLTDGQYVSANDAYNVQFRLQPGCANWNVDACRWIKQLISSEDLKFLDKDDFMNCRWCILVFHLIMREDPNCAIHHKVVDVLGDRVRPRILNYNRDLGFSDELNEIFLACVCACGLPTKRERLKLPHLDTWSTGKCLSSLRTK